MTEPAHTPGRFDGPPLSPRALARKRDALPALRAEVSARARRRRAFRAASACALVLCLGAGAWLAISGLKTPRSPAPDEQIAQGSGPPPPAVDTAPAQRDRADVREMMVSTGDVRVAGLVVNTRHEDAAGAMIDDAGMIALLARAGRPTGIVRIGDKAFAAADLERARTAPRGPSG